MILASEPQRVKHTWIILASEPRESITDHTSQCFWIQVWKKVGLRQQCVCVSSGTHCDGWLPPIHLQHAQDDQLVHDVYEVKVPNLQQLNVLNAMRI